MKKWSLLFFICLVATTVFGQRKKKKDPYADYWALEAKKERYDSAMKVADRFFEADKLEKATDTYRAAVKIWPEGQEAQAKIRDIQILKERRAAARQLEPKKETPTLVEEPIETTPPDSTKADSTKKTSRELPVRKLEVDSLPVGAIETKEEHAADTLARQQLKVEKLEKEKPQRELPAKSLETKEVKPKKIETATPKADTLYQSHEVLKNKEVWEIVSIQNNNKVVYRKVKHVYGAIYYFKDEEAITRNRYLEETEALLNK